MNLNDLLGWISRNGMAAFLIGCFLSGLAITFANWMIHTVRAITGHYPPARPVSCSHLSQCYCCRNGACNENCRCYQLPDEEDEDDENDEEEDA